MALTTEDRSNTSSSDIHPYRRSGNTMVGMSSCIADLTYFAAKRFFSLSFPGGGLCVGFSFCRQFLLSAEILGVLFLLPHDTPLSILSR